MKQNLVLYIAISLRTPKTIVLRLLHKIFNIFKSHQSCEISVFVEVIAMVYTSSLLEYNPSNIT